MVIRYVSAGDRLNYGDFLFSLIFKEYFQDNFEIKYYGIVESDFSYFGALPTQSYEVLAEEIQCKEDVIVVGGGEVFFAKWKALYSFIYPWYSFIKNNRYLNKIESILNPSGRFFHQNKNEFPFIPNFQCENIYISVGGQFSNNLMKNESDYLKKNLWRSSFISVRDKRTFLSLKINDITSTLLPDSAILMSKVYTLDNLRAKLKEKDVLTINDKYIFLQVGKYKGPEDLKKFISDINKIANKRNLIVLCCPIGVAPGHEDHKILKKLCKLDLKWKFVDPDNLYEIMYLIAKSEMYIGTSLHGLITAFSYNKPAIALNKDVIKTNSFIETWCSDFYEQSVGYEELADKSILKKWDKNKARLQLDYCQRLVENYFSEIDTYLRHKNDKTPHLNCV